MTEIWTSILKHIEGKLDPKELKTWFGPTRQVSFDSTAGAGVLTISVPSRVFADWIESRHGDLLAREAAAVGYPELTIRFEAIGPESHEVAAATVAAQTAPGRVSASNPRFTFENFVVGNSNQFAHAAARAVAESPSRSYNPLFLYGGVGLGKTHLMHAIAQEILRRNPDARVLYLSAERFLNDLINALRFERMHEFKRRYRELDVLLMDDVQFIAGKDSTQEEFFHTFNALHDAQKQIVVTSDALPKEIPTLEERLRSRFEWGLIADIQPPDLEMKVAIIRKKAEAEQADVPNDVALFIAGTVKSNVRELEGRLNRVIAFSSLTGKPLTVELARETLRDIVGNEEQRAVPSEILKTVASHYGLRVSDMKAKSNAKPVAFPRQVAMYLCRKLTELSYPEIGRLFNDKHHSTVMHSVEKIERMLEDDADFRRVVEGFLQPYR
ncbi:MAG TPA: chromosomal replication initiator protein DnaA [Thermoanaerobaculia bacterium]|jgi:chromosomal replication initiator protein|nr:chromosomal replication initiator protein DnaA [Thermoanaerobaculia bacterium]